MKIAKKLLAMLVVLAMVMGLTSATMFANSDIRVVVDGYEVNFVDQGPIMEDGRILAPVRGVFTHMGFVPSWNNDTRVATLTGDGVTVVIPVGSLHFYVNGERVNTDVASTILNGRVMLPLGAIATAVGATAAWDGAARVATVVTVAYEPTPVEDEDYDYDVEDEDYDVEDEDYDVEDEDYDVEDEDYDVEDEDYDDDNDQADDTHPLVGSWSYSDHGVVAWTFNADGTGSVYDAEGGINVTWSVADGLLTIALNESVVWHFYYYVDGDEFGLRELDLEHTAIFTRM